jgi:hypothetical protein
MNRFAALFLTITIGCLSFLGKANGIDSVAWKRLVQFELNNQVNANGIISTPVEKSRREFTNLFLDSFRTILETEESFTYPFDSFHSIKAITSKDGNLKLYTFNLILNNESHHYYGFVQRKTKEGVEVFELVDTANILPQEHLFAELYSNEWIGGLYYDIFQFKKKGITYYTVLAYDGDTRLSSKKFIDVIWFNKEGELVFGAPLFHMDENDFEPQYRFILEYANETTIGLGFEVTKKNKHLIVFDHLQPREFELKGLNEYYYPDGSYDYFKLKKKKWIMYKLLRDFDFKGYE